MTERSTLKLRLAVPGTLVGDDAGRKAREIVGDRAEILAVKWGRPKSQWIEDGSDWGNKPRLTAWERGYVTAVKSIDPENVLIAIIEGMART